MSRAKRDSDDERQEAPDGAQEEDLLDLDDLDERGVDGMIADLEPIDLRGPRRPAWVSLVVLVLALPLLWQMFPDFRYWIQPSEPVELGDVADLMKDGRLPSGYRDRYVAIEGTPDVRNVAVGRSRTQTIRYMRTTGSAGQLIAVVRSPADDEPDGGTIQYPGRFVGRMTRLGDLGRSSWSPWSEPSQYRWLEEFYELEDVTRTIDSTPDALVRALEHRSGDALEIDSAEGPIPIAARDRVRLVTSRPEVRLLLGAALLSGSEADARVAELGFPQMRLESSDTTRHRFVVRIPEEARDEVEHRLRALVASEIVAGDPRREIALLPMTATFTVPAADLQWVSGQVRFRRGDNTTGPGYRVEGDALVEEDPSEMLAVPREDLRAVRLEQPIRLDPNGYALLHDATPSGQRLPGVLWLFTWLVVLANGAWLLWTWRRARAADGGIAPTARN